MKSIRILVYVFVFCILGGSKSSVKKQHDKVYSRHLQRSVDLSIIATTLPDKKEEMNLLLLINNDLIDENDAKDIVDSLFKNKKIQPMILIAFKGSMGDYGLEEMESKEAKQYKKFNDFVGDELFPFVKKKTVIRKFKSVAIGGLGTAAVSAFDIAWNNDEKISKLGMFETDFKGAIYKNDSVLLANINKLRKRPNLKLWLAANSADTSIHHFKKMMDDKKSIEECILTTNASNLRRENFASFLQWAFPR